MKSSGIRMTIASCWCSFSCQQLYYGTVDSLYPGEIVEPHRQAKINAARELQSPKGMLRSAVRVATAGRGVQG